jgi:hypothetical protein
MSDRCSEISLTAAEPIAATATTAERWLLLEVPGAWPHDVGDPGTLPDIVRAAVGRWLEATPRSRLQFIRRPGRVSDRLLAFVVTSRERKRSVRRVELERYAELADMDIDAAGDPLDSSLLLVCGHGSRDRCCAVYGTPVYGALADRLGGEEVWISSHQGGHRFAANLLVLPAGLQFGRVQLAEAPLVAARALAGRIDLGHYRGRTCYAGDVQAAEAAVRREASLEGVSDVELCGREDGGVRFRTWGGEEYLVAVEETEGPLVPASCDEEPKPQRHFRAASVTRLGRVSA